MSSKKLIGAYRAIHYWTEGLRDSLWKRARPVLTNDEQRQAVYDADALIQEAREKLESVFGPEIGKAMIAEVKT